MADEVTQQDLDTFKKMGGRPILPRGVRSVGDIPAVDIPWNFGVTPKTPAVKATIDAKPTLYSRFPKMQGAWDGKTSVNHWKAVKNVLGDKAEELIQQQPRGTCGGRSGSAGIDIVECIMIGTGKRAKFHRASHAALYWMARHLYKMDRGGNWRDEDDDGVASGSIPEAMSKLGVAHRDESGDATWYGDGSDDLACQLGAGMHKDLQTKILEMSKDNVVTEWAPVNSAQEAADGIASGGILIGSDDQGFSSSRDGEGCCSPRGIWYHYHLRIGIEVLQSGRKVFPYFQSWGKNTPGGPSLPGYPGNVFGVDWNVQDRLIRGGDYAIVFGFPLWELEQGPIDIPWIFT